jgi:hypothetical protein
MASVIVGEGEAWLGDQRMPAGLALRGAGLQPMVLEAKEGLALINGTQFSTAWAALACADAERVWEAGLGAAALSIEVLLGLVPAGARGHSIPPALPGRAGSGAPAARVLARQRARGVAQGLWSCSGRLQPALRAPGDGRVVGRDPARGAAARGGAERRQRQPARVRRVGRDRVGGAVPRAARGPRGRLPEARRGRDRVALRASHRPPAGFARLRSARGARGQPGARVGLHARPVHRGGARLREQDARAPGERRQHPHRAPASRTT